MTNEVTKAAQELGRRGGNTTLKKYGKEYFKRINKLSQEARYGKKAEDTDKRSS